MLKRVPDFQNVADVLAGRPPSRPTLYEFFLNGPLYERLAGRSAPPGGEWLPQYRFMADAFGAAGYDYASVPASTYAFPRGAREAMSTLSLDDGIVIRNRRDFDDLQWQDPEDFDTDALAEIERELPGGMKLITHGPGGVLENAVRLCGYQGLCYLMADDPELVEDVFAAVGGGLERYYRLAVQYPSVGAGMVNDDWGFKTQTMVGVADMRKYVFPWHKRIVTVIHEAGKPAILHSCGNLGEVMDDVVEDMGFDAKHSFEDAIMPVEEACDAYRGRIALLGGIDVDFICRATPAQVRKRSEAMLPYHQRGGYALGSGNSIPTYVPQDAYFAMTSAFLEA